MTTRDRIAEPWGTRTPYAAGQPWPVRVDSHLAEGLSPEDVDRWVQTASILHSNGDALDIAVKEEQIVGVRGRAGDRVNHGRLGVKDLYGWQANASPDRLTRPLIRENGKLVETDWDTAMERIVSRTNELLEERGPSALGFYTTGQLFAEEYYNPRSDCARRSGDQPCRRQHQVMYGYGCGRAEGVLRQRRPTRFVHRYRPRRCHRVVRA